MLGFVFLGGVVVYLILQAKQGSESVPSNPSPSLYDSIEYSGSQQPI